MHSRTGRGIAGTARALMRISRSGVSPSWLLSVSARKRSLSSASLALEISSRRKISCAPHPKTCQLRVCVLRTARKGKEGCRMHGAPTHWAIPQCFALNGTSTAMYMRAEEHTCLVTACLAAQTYPRKRSRRCVALG